MAIGNGIAIAIGIDSVFWLKPKDLSHNFKHVQFPRAPHSLLIISLCSDIHVHNMCTNE